MGCLHKENSLLKEEILLLNMIKNQAKIKKGKEMKLIKQGAEALLYRDGNRLIKERVSKGYRIKEIDDRIRKLRTRSEGKLLQKVENTPKIFLVDERNFKIEMEFIDGDLVRCY